jgi:hypothetical protein
MMMAKMTAKKVLQSKTRRIRNRTGWASCPTDSFAAFKDCARVNLERKDIGNTIREHVRASFNRKEAGLILAAPEWAITLPTHVAATVEWAKLGFGFPAGWDVDKIYDQAFSEMKARGKISADTRKSKPKTSTKPRKTPSEIVQDQSNDFIAEVEGTIDEFFELCGPLDHFDVPNYCVFNELKAAGSAYKTGKAVSEYYTPILEEAVLIASKKPPKDLDEAYATWDDKRRKEYLLLITNIVEDAQKYMQTKLSQRKTRTPRAKTADKQVSKVQYLKESVEFKMVSVDPANIVGAKRLYTFNPRTRVLSEFVTSSSKGFEVKGSTLLNVDEVTSREARIKPAQFLPIVMQQTPTKVAAAWKKLKSKSSVPTPRLSRGTLLLKVMNK